MVVLRFVLVIEVGVLGSDSEEDDWVQRGKGVVQKKGNLGRWDWVASELRNGVGGLDEGSGKVEPRRWV